MERLQVFDDNKRMLNEYVERDRKKELPQGKNFMIILLFIQNSEGKFLIQKVSLEKGGVYATTGGHTTYGDNNVITALKECEEELGIKLEESDLQLVSSEKMQYCFVDTFYCQKDLNIDDSNLQTEEVENVFWMSIDEIRKLIEKGQFRKGNIPALENVLHFVESKKGKTINYTK